MSARPIRADRRLGQNFLVDSNVLDVIERLGALGDDDVVLEIGPGPGALTERLVGRAAHVHAIELDERFRATLEERLGSPANLSLRFEDALRADLGALSPAPDKLIANLPYSVATPVLMESVRRLPSVERWCVMVQREIADRILAPPGTRAYGAVSVLLQLTASRAGFHPVSRTCFSPVPNVDSALVALERQRRWGADYEPLRQIVVGAFAHRRKTLPNSLQLAGVAERERTIRALATLDRRSSARAEELAPEDFVKLASALEASA